MIDLHHKVAIHPQFALPLPLGPRTGRRVWSRQCEEQKKGTVLFLFAYKGLRLAIESFQHFVILKVFLRRSHSIESTPAFLRSDLSLPDIITGKSIGIHV